MLVGEHLILISRLLSCFGYRKHSGTTSQKSACVLFLLLIVYICLHWSRILCVSSVSCGSSLPPVCIASGCFVSIHGVCRHRSLALRFFLCISLSVSCLSCLSLVSVPLPQILFFLPDFITVHTLLHILALAPLIHIACVHRGLVVVVCIYRVSAFIHHLFIFFFHLVSRLLSLIAVGITLSNAIFLLPSPASTHHLLALRVRFYLHPQSPQLSHLPSPCPVATLSGPEPREDRSAARC